LPEVDNTFSIQSNKDAKYVYINVGKGSENISDNYFDLKAGEKKLLSFSDRDFSPTSAKSMKIISLYDVLSK
jgi:beta-mannosidase